MCEKTFLQTVQLFGTRCSYLIVSGELFRELVKGDQGNNSTWSFLGASMIRAALPEAADMAFDVACFAIVQKVSSVS